MVFYNDRSKIDMKKCNFSKDLAQDRSDWRNRIHVADPNIVGTRLMTMMIGWLLRSLYKV